MLKSEYFSKPYQSHTTEEKINSFWDKNQFYRSVPNSKKQPFTIVMPPPNITGDLTMGHMMYALQDILIRWHRAMGREACWIPGTDHASIATEAKVTKMLKEQGISKRELGREEFLKKAWDWKEEYGGRIAEALKGLGVSCDWSRLTFTMDPKYYRSVIKAIVKLYHDGLIYKKRRLVNWCPASQSVISDEEVHFEERNGHLWHIRYYLEDDSSQYLVVATTRPETLFGDLAVAVHPEDSRYASFIGKNVVLPLCDRVIPIVGDTYVDKDFGTGVVKITPAHDKNDFEVGKRHNLGLKNIMNPDGTLNEEVPLDFQGLDRFDARKKLIQELEQTNHIEKIEPHRLNVGISERGHVPIEYYLSDQWYISMEGLAQKTLETTRTGDLRLIPGYQEKVWEHWLTNIQDWCISRQLWWGHRLPMYTCQKCQHVNCAVDCPKACEKCQHEDLKQDEDVLDTWASSWIWPFGVHNWENPSEEEKRDLEYYYPTDVIITGGDIIFFWIARMVMAGKYFLNEVPFHKCYFTPIVRDRHGKKMSKSLGNSPNIHKIRSDYGTDALRFSLVNQIFEGQDIFWKDESCDIGKNFANKIWNSTRFLLMNAEKYEIPVGDINFENLGTFSFESPILSWIRAEFYQMVQGVHEAVDRFQFSQITSQLYEFVWMIFCDWFIELSKPELGDEKTAAQKQNHLKCALGLWDGVLRLLHPVMPFLTEEIWQLLHVSDGVAKTLGHAQMPLPHGDLVSEEAIARMRLIQNVVTQVRGIRGRFQIHPGTEVQVYTTQNAEIFGSLIPQLEFLSKAKFIFEKDCSEFHAPILIQDKKFLVKLDGLVDRNAEQERLEKRIDKIDSILKALNAKLNNEKFVSGAPEKILEGARSQKLENEKEKELLKSSLELLKKG